MNALGPSWKPRIAGILTLVVPPAIWAGLTKGLKLDESTANTVSGAVLAALASYGLFNAKQHDVSNSPAPLLQAKPVVDPLKP
jgi:hypothetical protein